MTSHAVPIRTARVPNADNFSSYGRVISLDDPERADVITTRAKDWSDAYTREPLVAQNPHLGRTLAPSAPFLSSSMERHEHVEEALIPAGAPIVLAVAIHSGADAPEANNVEAFLINPGTAVVLNKGIWHDACRGAVGPTAYYWLSSCSDAGSSSWTPILGGPVDVQVPA